jgi:hypothetical protein
MKKSLGFLSLAAAAVFAAPAHAQLPNVTPFSFEVRGGLAAPLGDFGSDDEETGYGAKMGTSLGGNATFHFMPLLGIYAGYTRNQFDVEGEDDADIIDSGFEAGVRLAVPTPLIPIDPYVKLGAVYHDLKLQASDGGATFGFTSDRSLGFEVGAGIGIGLGPKLSFTPQVTYTRYSPQFDDEVEELTGEAPDVSHVRVDVGLRIRL